MTNQITWKPAKKVTSHISYAKVGGRKPKRPTNDQILTQTKWEELTIQDIWGILQSIQQKTSNTERSLELLEESKSSWTTVKNKK